MKRTLVVIDVQPHFVDLIPVDIGQSCLEAVKELMREAVRKRRPVVGLHMDPTEEYGLLEDLIPIRSRLYQWVCKESEDGSAEVLKCVEENGFPYSFDVCGMYGNQCVQDTVLGLTKLVPEASIALHSQACVEWGPVASKEILTRRYSAIPTIRVL